MDTVRIPEGCYLKVICNAPVGHKWISEEGGEARVVTTSRFFGLFKSSKIVFLPTKCPGPENWELCIVTGFSRAWGEMYYQLKGYPDGQHYNKRHFRNIEKVI